MKQNIERVHFAYDAVNFWSIESDEKTPTSIKFHVKIKPHRPNLYTVPANFY